MERPVTANLGKRFHYLDGIRGVAAFLVVFFHFRNAFFDASNNKASYKYFWQKLDLFFLKAEFSVQLFFVLSGFVLAYNSYEKKGFLKKQWLKRYYRLVVPVFISSLLYYFFIKSGMVSFNIFSNVYTNEWIQKHWQVSYTFPQFLVHFFISFLFFSDWQFILAINSSLWTIPIELLWSYILFAHFYIMGFIKKFWIKNGFLLFSILFLIRFAETTGENYAVLFLGGAMMALNYKSIRAFFQPVYRCYLLLLIAICYTIIVEKGWLKESPSFPFQWSFFAAMLYLLIALVSAKIQNLFSHFILQWLGRISFSLYLLHLLIIGSVSSWLYFEFPFFRINAGLLLLLAISLALSLAIAHFFSRYIDEPLMSLYDKVYVRVTSKQKNKD